MVLLAGGAAAAWYAATPSPQERFRRGVEAFRAGDRATLESQASALSGVQGYESQAALLSGMALFQKGRLRAAVETIGRATGNPETRAAAFSLAGEAFYKLHRPGDARQALTEAVRLSPEDVAARRWLASADYDLGLMPEALTHLRKVAELAPDDPRPDRLAGLIQKDFENYGEAVAPYRESLRRDPNRADADEVRAELAECLIKLLRPDEALEALAPAKDTATVLTLRGEAERAKGDAEASRRLFLRALEQDPNHARALTLLGTTETEAGSTADAIGHLEKAARLEPADFEVRYKLAQALRLAGRAADAEREDRRATELRELRTRFTDLHDRAMKAPTDAQVRCDLGKVALELGRDDLAAMWFEAALAIDGNRNDAREALIALGNAAAAGGPPAAGR